MNRPIVPLGELCDIDRQGLHPDDPIASDLPFVGVEQVESNNGTFNFNSGSRIGSQRSTAFRFDDRHVLYARLRPYLNKVATPEFAGRCSTELVPLLPRNGVDREFIAYVLRRRETVEYVMGSVTGARMPRTDMKALLSLPVPLPPLNEQRRIVGILNQVAKIEQLQAQAAERLREFTPALFINMFGDPVENPMGWEAFPLGDVIRVSSGQGLSSKNMVPGNYPVYGSNGISGYHSEFMFESQKITIGRVGACGVIHVSQPNSWITDNALYVRRVLQPINFTYLECALRMANLNRYADRAAQPLISGSRIYPVEIMMPDEDVQETFCQHVRTARAIAITSEASRRAATMLSTSLMARLLNDGT